MSLQTNFAKQRNYYFWAIFLSYLVSKDIKSSEAEKKLFGTLAYRMISKAADSVPSNQVCLFPPSKAVIGVLIMLIGFAERIAERASSDTKVRRAVPLGEDLPIPAALRGNCKDT